MDDNAVKVAREALANEYDKTGWHDQAARIRDVRQLDTDPLKFAILGARAMQAAVPAPAGVPLIDAEAIAKAADDALVSGIHLVWEANGYARDVLLPPNEMRSRVRAAIISAIEGAGAREGAGLPSDGSCARCGAVPRNASGLCATCVDEDAERAGEIEDATAQGLWRQALDQERVPTPAGAGDLVERLRKEAHETKIGGPTWGDGSVMDEAASRIEAVIAELAELRERTDKQWEVIEKDCYIGSSREKSMTARATTAEAEVERKDKALREAGEAIAEYFRYLNGGETRGSYDGKPEREGLRKAGYAVSRALAPAKAGG